MRRAIFRIAGIVIFGLISVLAGLTYLRRENAHTVERAKMLAADLQQLRVGLSDYKAGQSLAAKFGTVPYKNHYGARDCTTGYFERCTYMIAINHSRMNVLLGKHPFLRHFGFGEWSGSALIYIETGTVKEYSFSVVYRASNGQWRGFGAEESPTLPQYRAVQARVSESYSVERNDVLMGEREINLGFELKSSLIPTSTATERQRAWHFEFTCLAQPSGCGETCEVMPDAWRDFYNKRGHFDVEKYGSAYLFCSKPPS